MWERLKRFFRAVFGGSLRDIEDPRAVLERNIREMRDRIPEMNRAIARAKSLCIQLENETKGRESEASALTAKIKTCLANGQERLAADFARRLKVVRGGLDRDGDKVRDARAAYGMLLRRKEQYHREVRARTEEAMAAIREAEAAKWKHDLADIFESIDVAGLDQSHREMIERLRAQSAEAEARLSMAVETANMADIELEEQAAEQEAQEILKTFRAELGLPPEPRAAAESADDRRRRENGARLPE